MTDYSNMKSTFSKALIDMTEHGMDVAAVDADLMRIVGTGEFMEAHPKRHFQVGIAEQNLVGTAAGLALMGKTVFATTFTNFISLRAADQVCNAVCYNNLDVKVCGIYAGITSEKNGGTHISVGDVAVFRSIPGMRIIDPGDGEELYQVMWEAAKTPGPFYIRISKGPMPKILPDGYVFQTGKGVELNQGNDATLITGGLTTKFGVEACKSLAAEGIFVRHIHMPTIKPIDRETVLKAARETGRIFVAENHSVIGGLGSAVAETVCDEWPVPVERMGVEDTFCVGASVAHLSNKHGFSAEKIAQRIRTALKK